MKVLVGGIHQEANTFSGIKTAYNDFRRYHGRKLVNYLSQCSLLEEAGIEIIPAVFARTIPSAPLNQEEFDEFVKDFFSSYDENEVPDAIYLCMHGAMYIRGIGSGELYFIEKLRKKYGKDITIFASFDFHGNMFPKLAAQLNYVTAYKTAPHVDETETGERAVKALIDSMRNGIIPKVKCIQIPMTFPGEMVITDDSPSREIIRYIEEIVREKLALEVSWFCGFIWSDAKENHMSLAISADKFSGQLEERVKNTVKFIWSKRNEFHFGTLALEVTDALHKVLEESKKTKKIFLSDSGDNVTAGTSGDNAFMAGAILEYINSNKIYRNRKILIAGISDKDAVNKCMEMDKGDILELSIGGKLDCTSAVVRGCFTLVRKGMIGESFINSAMTYALIRHENVDILLNAKRYAYTEPVQFEMLGINLEEYDVICIKLGYLYTKLQETANGAVIAFSPGNAPQRPQLIPYSSERNDFYPLADVGFDVEKRWKEWWNYE